MKIVRLMLRFQAALRSSMLLRSVSLFSLFAGCSLAQTSPSVALPAAPEYYLVTPTNTSVNSSGNVIVGESNLLLFTPTGGTGPYTLSLSSGQLPAGLSIVPSETVVGGVSTAVGPYTFTLTVTDSSSPVQTASQSYTISAVALDLSIGGTLVGGLVGQPYGIGSALPPVYARYGVPPYQWSVLAGTVPAGMTANASTPAFGAGTSLPSPTSELSGTPQTPGTFSFFLQVTDSAGNTATQTYALSVIALNPSKPDPSGGAPFGIVVGPDGNLWFTQPSPVTFKPAEVYGLESITTGGVFGNETELTAQVPGTGGNLVYPNPQSIALGPDGNFWITDNADAAIVAAKSGAAGPVVTLHSESGAPLFPTGITSGGAGGGVWFSSIEGSSPGTGVIGQINTANPGSPTLYTVPQTASYPTGIVENPLDGNAIWFTDQTGSPTDATQDAVVIGRIPVPVNAANPFALPAGCQASNTQLGVTLNECVIAATRGHVLGPLYGEAPVGPLMQVDSTGTVWFASRDQVGSISVDGSTVNVFQIPLATASTTFRINSLALGPDGAIWFIGFDAASAANDLIGRVAVSGTNSTITEFSIPEGAIDAGYPNLQAIVTGPDGALWFTDSNGPIVQFFPSLALNCSVPPVLYLNAPVPANAQCAAIGGKGPYTFSYDTTNAPQGVTISPSGVISGTPTTTGTFNIKVSDNSSPAQQANQVISIQTPPVIQLTCSFPPGTAGQPYSGFCTTMSGNPPYSYAIAPTGALAALGLTGTPVSPTPSNSNYGYSVSGTLSVTANGAPSFMIQASDSTTPVANTSAVVTVTIAITASPVSLSCNPSAQAVIGQPFQQQCFASSGTPPYTYSASGLPAGLTINPSSGIISGVAAATGQAAVTVVVSDNNNLTATQTINFSVVNAQLSLFCAFPPSANVGTAFAATCTATGGVGPYTFSVVSGTLPPGLTLNPATGAISGAPTGISTGPFSIQASDSESPAASARYVESLFVVPLQLTILSTSLPVPNGALPYAALPDVQGGTPPYLFAITSGALPGGLQLSATSGIISSVLPSGATVPGSSLSTGPYSFTLQVTDSAQPPAMATQAYSGTVSTTLLQEVINSYPLPSPSGANGITVGPDSALWFTTLDVPGGNLIGSITTVGAIDSVPSANALTKTNGSELPTGGDITPGPDGNMWMAQRDANTVGEITIGGASQSTYVPPTANSGPAQITAGPDGTLWFTEATASQIAHVAPGGAMLEFPTPTPNAYPLGISSGPGNFVFFTEALANKIGYISTDGTVSADLSIPTAGAVPTSIVLGVDYAFWFTEYGANKIGRLDFSGNFTEFPVTSTPTAITVGPDGALYFTESAGGLVGRLTIAGALNEYAVPDGNSSPTGIVAGPDGALWFTESATSTIGRLNFIFGPTVTCTLPSSPQIALSTFSATCSATQGTPPYTFSFSGTPPPGLAIDATSGVISGTLTTAGTFAFNVVATDSSIPTPLPGQQSYTFTVTPLPVGITCTTPAANLYAAYVSSAQGSYGCSATNGTPPYMFALTSGTLPAGLTLQTSTGTITGAPTAIGSFPISVQVTDSSTPTMTAGASSTLLVQYGNTTSGGGALLSLSTTPTSVDPGGVVSGVTLTPNTPLLAPLSGTVTLSFTDCECLLNTQPGYVDPAMQFVDSNGNGAGTTYNFTIPAGSSSITLPNFNVGTVAGSIAITVTADNLEQAHGVTFVPQAAPVIESGSVQFTNQTASGFDVEFVATSATRSLTSVTVTLNPAAGDQILGQTAFTLDVTTIMNTWFQSAASLPYGGSFSLTIPFQLSGEISAIASATVTVSATAGNPSQPVTGTL
jgi:streptogramin lyase